MSVAAMGLLALLAVAAWLEPDPAGLGTHRQLGLPPCTFRAVVGRPCPTCGMTTSWAHLIRGELLEALQVNVAGTLLGLAALVAAPWMALLAIRGRWIGRPPGSTALAYAVVALFAVMLVDWVYRLLTT